jgi:hypothetical protein
MSQQAFKFIADTRFLTIMRSSIREATLVKKIGSSAFCLYVIIRSEVSVENGSTATLSYDHIQKLTGWSTATIAKCIAKLKEAELISVEHISGRVQIFTCRDVVPFVEVQNGQSEDKIRKEIEQGERKEYTGRATIDYVPNRMTINRQELVEFLRNGREPNSPQINIQNFYFQLNINGVEAAIEKVEDPELREALIRLAGKAGERKAMLEGVTVSIDKEKAKKT